MSSSGKVVYVALVGYPILEVAAIATSHGQTVEVFHQFVSYFNDIAESYLKEQEPLTDSFGTRFEHAIGEVQLGQNGVSLHQAQENLRRFLSALDVSWLVVNNLQHYQFLNLPVDANQVWNESNKSMTAMIKQEMKVRILQGKSCYGHHSLYYRFVGQKEPKCALMSAAKMAHELNYV